MLLSLSALLLVTASPAVSVSAKEAPACVSVDAIRARLAADGLRANGSGDVLQVRLSGTPMLRIDGRRGPHHFERTVASGGVGCGTLERLIVVLIESWASAPAPVQVPVAVVVEPEVAAPIESVEVATEPVPVPVQSIEQPARPARTPIRSPEGQRGEVIQVVETKPAPSALQVSVDVSLLGGVAGDASSAPVAALGVLGVRVNFGRFGVLLEGGLESTRTANPTLVVASVSMQWLALSPSIFFEPGDRWRIDLAAGFRGFRVVASASNLGLPSDQSLLFPGVAASVGVTWKLSDRWAVTARPWVSARFQPVRLTVEGIGPVFELNPWSAGLLLGLVLHLG